VRVKESRDRFIREALERLGNLRAKTSGFSLLLELAVPALVLEMGILLAYRSGILGGSTPWGGPPLFAVPLLLPAAGFVAGILRKPSPEETARELEKNAGNPQVVSTYLEISRRAPEHPFLSRLRRDAAEFLRRVLAELPRRFRLPPLRTRHTAIPVLAAVFVVLALLPLSAFDPEPRTAAEGEVLEELAERLAPGGESLSPERADLQERLERLGRELQRRRTNPDRAAERIEQLARRLEDLERSSGRSDTGGTFEEKAPSGTGDGERITLEDTASIRERLLAGAERLADLSRPEPLDPERIDQEDRLQAPPPAQASVPARPDEEEGEDREDRSGDEAVPGRGYLPPPEDSGRDASGGKGSESGPGSVGGTSPGDPVPGSSGSPRSDSLPGTEAEPSRDDKEKTGKDTEGIARLEGDPLPGESLTGFIRGLGTGEAKDWTKNGDVLESYRKLAERDMQNRAVPDQYRAVVRDYMLEIGVFNE
jgi:hypothetical protein